MLGTAFGMKRFAAKLGYVHRTLWRREQSYRWAALFGPPPLIGCAVAAVALAVAHTYAARAPAANAGSDVPWAHWNRPFAQGGQPFTESPGAALPSGDPHGGYAGYQNGWIGDIQPISVDATLDVNVIATSEGRFMLDQPSIPLERIVDAAPPTGLFVGVEKSFFVVRTPGLYAFSARLTRTGTQSANCLVRLASGRHQMLRTVVLNTAGTAVLNFAPTEFRLEPGLFFLQVAEGCWRGDRMVGAGELTLLVRHPDDTALKPATADEVIKPVQKSAAGAK